MLGVLGLGGLGLSTAWGEGPLPRFDQLEQMAQQRYGPQGLFRIQRWRKFVESNRSASVTEQLNACNRFLNQLIQFSDDRLFWQQPDYWATPLESIGRGGGDCEDYAIAKYITLGYLGVPRQHMRLIYVKIMYQGALQAHMVLGYYATPEAIPLVLDNINGELLAATNRPDLSPVFSFNAEGLWTGQANQPSNNPTARLSRWRDVLERMQQEGF